MAVKGGSRGGNKANDGGALWSDEKGIVREATGRRGGEGDKDGDVRRGDGQTGTFVRRLEDGHIHLDATVQIPLARSGQGHNVLCHECVGETVTDSDGQNAVASACSTPCGRIGVAPGCTVR